MKVQDEAAEHSTMSYRAPELFDCPTGSCMDEKVDIWSLGCVFYAILYGHSPFETIETTSGSIALAVLNCRYTFPASNTDLTSLNTIIERCLVLAPAQRPSAREILDLIEKIIQA